jgi:hypothetical protein
VSQRELVALMRLQSFQQGEQWREVAKVDRLLSRREVTDSSIFMTIEETELTSLGRRLTVIDRQLRRAVAILGPDLAFDSSEFTPQAADYDVLVEDARGGGSSLPTPIPMSLGGLRVTDAASGSLHFILEAYGAVQALLLSQPVAAFSTALALIGGWGNIRVWLRQRRDELKGLSARDVRTILDEFGSHPEQALKGIRPAIDIALGQESGRGVLVLPDGTQVAARSITYTRHNNDGSQDVLHIEG